MGARSHLVHFYRKLPLFWPNLQEKGSVGNLDVTSLVIDSILFRVHVSIFTTLPILGLGYRSVARHHGHACPLTHSRGLNITSPPPDMFLVEGGNPHGHENMRCSTQMACRAQHPTRVPNLKQPKKNTTFFFIIVWRCCLYVTT